MYLNHQVVILQWINGKPVVFHEIGHLPFQQEITNALNYGAENRITVAVDNTLTATSIPQGSVDQIHTYVVITHSKPYSFIILVVAGITFLKMP